MRTSRDPRHKRREKAIKTLFSWSFSTQQSSENELAKKIYQLKDKIDKIITESAPEWPIGQINKIDLAVLRLAVYELVVQPEEPPKVIIDEAIELAKAYGGEKSPSFVNGVLGTIFKKYLKQEKKGSNEKP